MGVLRVSVGCHVVHVQTPCLLRENEEMEILLNVGQSLSQYHIVSLKEGWAARVRPERCSVDL